MDTSHKNAGNQFSGKLNTDVDYRNIEPVDFIHSLNVRSQFGSTIGARENPQGNVLVPNTLPSGLNQCIGSVEDKQGGTLVYFVYNSLGSHTIWRYYPEEQTVSNDKGVIRKVLESSVLNFQLEMKIHSGVVLDNYLIWSNSTSNPPRMVDMDKAIMGKQLTYKLFLDATSFVDTETWAIVLTDSAGVQTLYPPLYTSTADPFATQVTALIAAIEAIDGVTTVKISNNLVIITSTTIDTTISITATSPSEILFHEFNHYPPTLLDYHINLIKPVPKLAPVGRYQQTGTMTSPNLNGFTFQFAYRYLFIDDSRSAFSPISQIPTAVDGTGAFDVLYNEIAIEINDTNLSDVGYLNLIKGIEVAVRYDDRGVFRRLGYYAREELSLNDIEITFTNNGVYAVIGSDEDGSADIQVFKQYESIPRFSETSIMLSDDKGRSRLLLGGNTEGYDVNVVPDVTIVVTSQASLPPATTSTQYNTKKLKNDGVYNWGMVYEDGYNRKSPVVPIGSSTRAYDLIVNSPKVEFQIDHLPPSWATHYRIVRTRNEYHEEYIQTVSAVNYVAIGNTTTKPVEKEYGDTGITHYEFVLAPPTSKSSDEDIVIMFHKLNEMLAVNPTQKHYIKLLYDMANPNTAAPLFDKALVGYDEAFYRVVDGIRLYVEYDENFIPDLSGIDRGGLLGGNNDIRWGVQVYKRREVLDEFYYETGHCFDITGGYHMGLEQNQTGGQPARVIFTGGDTYTKFLPAFLTSAGYALEYFETPYMFLNFSDTENEDIGRANIEDDNYREIVFSNALRISDLYISDSSVNGIPNFRSGNQSFVDKTFGALTRLVLSRDVLLAVCSFKIQPFYVGKAELIDLRANSLLATNSELLQQGQESVRDIGSTNGESIISEDGRVYGWDSYKRLWWRYAQNGVEAISREFLNSRKFRELGEDIAQHGGTFVYGGFERNYKTLYMTFEKIENSNGIVRSQTWAFEDSTLTGFIGEQSFTPEYYGRVGSHFVSFLNGAVWLHDYDNGLYCNFYDTQYPMKIKFAVNNPSPATKLFWNIRLQSNNKYVALIETHHGNRKMRSRLKSGKWTRYEGTYWADFLRNIDDTTFGSIASNTLREATALLHGEPLRGDVMLVELIAVSPSIRNVLYRSDVEFTVSHDTKIE